MDDPREVAAYDEADFTEVSRALAEHIINVAGDSGRAIDLGTGPACIPIELCALAPGWRVVAVDASRGMLRQARLRLRQAGLTRQIELLYCDVGALAKHRLRAFDLVFSNSLLHHLRNPIGFWHDMRHLVRRDATIVVQDLRRPSSARAAHRLVDKHAADDSPFLRELFERSLLAAYTPDEVYEQLRLAGLRGLRVAAITDRHLLVNGHIRW